MSMTNKFRRGQIVRVLKPHHLPDTFWVIGMDATIGKVGNIVSTDSTSYLVDVKPYNCWWYIEEELELFDGKAIINNYGDTE